MKKMLLAVSLLIFFGCGRQGDLNTIGQQDYEKIITERAGKVLVVNVFASWCPPCAAETPGFVRLYAEDGGENFEIIGLSIDTSRKDLDRFLARYKVNYPSYIIDEKLRRRLFADKVPTTLIYYPNGEYYTTVFGAINSAGLLDLVERAKNNYAKKN
jgi:thiol-disulfide isomerase/thioredoxin